ncbi:MAG: hypothetical protein KF795_30915, partial [Labilithrix sp.]|nr:hypothetical protein [Labilithrix sp.]
LFELLAGRLPFDAEDAPALFVAIATKDVPRLSEVDPTIAPSVSTIIERCLRRRPDDRYPTALELARDLRHVLEGDAIEPTQTRSIPPPALAPHAPPLVLPELVPDLVLPSRPSGGDAKWRGEAFAQTLSGPAPTGGLELASAPDPPALSLERPDAPGAVLELDAAPSALARGSVADVPAPGPPSASRMVAAPPSGRTEPSASPPPLRLEPSAPPPVTAGRIAADQALPGVMLAGSSTSSQRRPAAHAYRPEPSRHAPADMSFLVALGVVGLASIGVTAVLMTFVHRPEGWPIVAFVTKPTPTLNLAVQGGLGVVALVGAGKSAVGGVKKWTGAVPGGRGASIVAAVVAGGLFFATLQLARAAW